MFRHKRLTASLKLEKTNSLPLQLTPTEGRRALGLFKLAEQTQRALIQAAGSKPSAVPDLGKAIEDAVNSWWKEVNVNFHGIDIGTVPPFRDELRVLLLQIAKNLRRS